MLRQRAHITHFVSLACARVLCARREVHARVCVFARVSTVCVTSVWMCMCVCVCVCVCVGIPLLAAVVQVPREERPSEAVPTVGRSPFSHVDRCGRQRTGVDTRGGESSTCSSTRSFVRSFVTFVRDCLVVEYPVHDGGRPLTSIHPNPHARVKAAAAAAGPPSCTGYCTTKQSRMC